jgi:ATP-dependent helicase/nuclease subunit A
MKFNPTEKQKQAIDNRGALLVSAAAGSGKTAVLVERVVQCVLDENHPVDVNRLLVVTFTNAAAAEMKERIRLRLAEEAANDPTNLRLLRQQMLLEKANISTIDSFCKNLITQHFDRLSISPDFKLLSQNSLALIKKSAMTDTLNHFFAHQKEEFSRLAQMVGADRGTWNLEQAIETVYTYIRSLPFPKLWTDKVRKQYEETVPMEQSPWGKVLLARAEKILVRGITTLKNVMAQLPEDPVVEQKRGDRIGIGLLQMEDALHAVQNGGWDQVVSACGKLGKISFQGANLPRGYESAVKDATLYAQKVSEQVAGDLAKLFFMTSEECERQQELLAPMIGLLLDSVWEYSRRIDQKKQEQNSLDFSDVEYAALELLVTLEEGKPTPTPYANQLCETYDYVMVDEYQDVNDLQSEIFKAISNGGKNLFTVGDVKQSIYRFRKANPKNFLTMLENYPVYDGTASPAKVILDGNFRSRPQVCHTVNALFSLIMSVEAGELDYDENHLLNPKGVFPENPHCAVELDFLDGQGDRSSAQLEADRIAWHIKKAMETPCVTKNGQLVPATAGDCVILLRGLKNRGEIYVNRLREHGIPATAEQAEGFFERPEVARILSVLRAIDNPTDDVALLACMMSPLFGFTANQVGQIRGKSKKIPLILSVENAAQNGDAKAEEFLSVLGNLRVYAATVSAAKLLQRLYDRYGYLSAVQVMENGSQCRQNLITLLGLAEECAQNGFDRLDGFIRYTDRLQQEEVSFAPPGAAQSGQGVKIMSIHHAKGLQFPICFVAGCGNDFNRSDAAAPVLLDEKLGLGLTLTDDSLQVRKPTCMRLAVAAQNRRAELSEELRVLYVALTRAVDKLIVLTTFKNLPKKIADSISTLSGDGDNTRLDPELTLSALSYGQLLLYFALLHPAGQVLRLHGIGDFGWLQANEQDCVVNLPKGEEIPLPAMKDQSQLQFPVDHQLVEKLGELLTYENPYAPLQNVFSKRSVSQLVHGEISAMQGIPRPAFMQTGGLTPAEKGTTLHTFMQYADFSAAAKNPQAEVERLLQKQYLTKRQADYIEIQPLQAFFDSPLYARMANALTLTREQRFMTFVPATRLEPSLPSRFEEEKIVVQGIVDCLFEEADGLVVVDYKTDRVKTPEELLERYGKQLQLYADMLKETQNKPVKELLLYSFTLHTTVTVPLD